MGPARSSFPCADPSLSASGAEGIHGPIPISDHMGYIENKVYFAERMGTRPGRRSPIRIDAKSQAEESSPEERA